MRFYIACILLFLMTARASFGQIYKYIGVTEGLSDHRVLSIQKDKDGFMWFLTYTGIDRYDGKNIKHYRLQSDEGYISSYSERNILKIDTFGRVWAMGPEGELFKYVPSQDSFMEVQLPVEVRDYPLALVEMTDFNEVWFCFSDFSYVYDQNEETLQRIVFDHQHKHITCICQYDENTYYIGSDDGVCRTVIKDGQMVAAECIIPANDFQIPQFLYIHRPTNRLFVGSELSGLMVYDLTIGRMEHLYSYLKDFPISGMDSYKEDQLLVSTRGAGVFLYDLQRSELKQFASAEYERDLKMNGNNIRALYVDDYKRVWMSVYGRGVTCYDETLPAYTLYKHHKGNEASLTDDLVNAVLEDSDGDLWFATNNGLSVYSPSTKTWQRFFAWDKSDPETLKDCIFLSLCETSPGIIVTGGFMTGVYIINKNTKEVRKLTPYSYKRSKNPNFSNKYIRVIHVDDEGVVWTGGSYYLGRTDRVKGDFQNFFIGKAITCILEKDSTELLIGTGDGIYLFNKRTFEKKKLRMPFASQQINAMYLHTDGDLYIGTTNSGLVVLHKNGEYDIHRYQTTALLSNTVNTIVPANNDELVIATEKNIALYHIKEKVFRNWTEDQGLIKAHFNPRAGIHTSRGTLVFGSNEGAVEWVDTMKLMKRDSTRVIIDQILVDNQTSAFSVEDVAGINMLDSIREIRLKHNQNSMSLHVVAIDYGNPQYTYFRWKLNGRHDYWTQMEGNSWLQFRGLKPGEYVLKIQNIAREDYRVLGEKALKIVILPSFWQTSWGTLLFLFCIGVLSFFMWHYVKLERKQKRIKGLNKLLVSAVGGIRTPMALIKAATKEVTQQETLSSCSQNYMQLVTYCAESLDVMACNLTNVELESNIRRLEVEWCDVNELCQSYAKRFEPLLAQEQVEVLFENQEQQFFVWTDRKKVELIFCNLFACLLRYTPKSGVIHVSLEGNERFWKVVLHNRTTFLEGEEKKQNLHINKDLLEQEMLVIRRLVKAHYGKLCYEVFAPSAYLFGAEFPMKHSYYIKPRNKRPKVQMPVSDFSVWKYLPHLTSQPVREVGLEKKKGHILLVEEDKEVLAFLDNSLNGEWEISMARSKSIAIGLVREFQPDIVVASFAKNQEPGDDICSILKSDMNTSHIPIVLMTLEDDKDVITDGFKFRADYFVTKPFDLFVLRAILTNIIENRRLLQERLTQVDVVHNLKEIRNVNVERESKFLADVKRLIKENIDNPEFNVDELCGLMSMSRTSLYSKVKTLTGMSPSDIIRDIRMQRACELLLSNEYNIMEVSDHMGFSEPKYFREVFKKHYGISPSEYIKKHNGVKSV